MSIQVESVDMFKADNAKTHHTDMYEAIEDPGDSTVILRRGQPFYVDIRFQRKPEFQTDRILLQFSYGPFPHYQKGTLIRIPVYSNTQFRRNKQFWDCRLYRDNGWALTLEVQVPATIPVGKWNFRIISYARSAPRANVFDVKDSIYILFNPWSTDDTVHMADEKLLEEYVLNPVGKIFQELKGSPRQWMYGQFNKVVLKASVFLLDKIYIYPHSRGDAIRVVRALSAIINHLDDRGVLVGNWSDNFKGGKAPWDWTGSTAILEQYYTSGGEPVKFGQCWVFAGVFTTVCRALGIPTRTVTCINSAHDNDGNLYIERYWDKDGKIQKGKSESIWNFHVWNECWMRRPDLQSDEYEGWQACDATPQEKSAGIFQLGPASVRAIREQKIGFVYDIPFVLAEVDAVIVDYIEDENSPDGYKVVNVDRTTVGTAVLTKRPGNDDRYDIENITEQYKPPEGFEGRIAEAGLPTVETGDVMFTVRLDMEDVLIGNTFKITLEANNNSDEKRTVHAIVTADSVYYRGDVAKNLKRYEETFGLEPKAVIERTIELTAEDYLDKLVDTNKIKIHAMSTVKETDKHWSTDTDLTIQNPSLSLEIRGQPKRGVPFTLSVRFKNPLKRVLGDCSFSLESPGLSNPHSSSFRDIQPEEEIDYTEEFVPKTSGTKSIVVVFSSNLIRNVTSSMQVKVAV